MENTQGVSENETVCKAVDDSQTSDVTLALKSNFIERVAEIPVVDAARKYGTSAYKQLKEYNSVSSYAFTKAEETAIFLACSALPFIRKLEPQVKAVDNLACHGLDMVEGKVPILTKPTNEIIEETRKLCASTVQSGYQKVEEIKNLGTEAVSRVKNYSVMKANEALETPYGQVLTNTVGECLTGTESFVDKHLPPTEDNEATLQDNLSLPERASNLKNKVSNRLYNHGLLHVQKLHSRGQETIEKLTYTIDLMKYLKDNYTSGQSLQNYVDEAKIKASWIWEELNKEQPLENANSEKSIEQRLLSLARRITAHLVHTYTITSVSLKEFPQRYRDNVSAASSYAIEVFTHLDKAAEAKEVTSAVLYLVRDKVTALERTVRSFLESNPEQEMIEMNVCEKTSLSEESSLDNKESDAISEPK